MSKRKISFILGIFMFSLFFILGIWAFPLLSLICEYLGAIIILETGMFLIFFGVGCFYD